MILLTRCHKTILLVGSGLIGSAIFRELRRHSDTKLILQQPYPWRADLNDQKVVLDRFLRLLSRDLMVIWCAGKTGFGSGKQETEREWENFQSVIDRLQQSALLRFFFLSSGGGLFEGEKLIDPHSPLHLMRPYAQLKNRQENYLLDASSQFSSEIFRLSSVYGYIHPHQRMGLISTLMLRTLRHQTVEIVGHLHTLRDYLWVEDVARYIVSRIETPPSMKIWTLASGRPMSLLEIRGMVEDITGKKAYLTFLKDPTNSADITYSPHALPLDFYPTDLRVNLQKIYLHYLSHV